MAHFVVLSNLHPATKRRIGSADLLVPGGYPQHWARTTRAPWPPRKGRANTSTPTQTAPPPSTAAVRVTHPGAAPRFRAPYPSAAHFHAPVVHCAPPPGSISATAAVFARHGYSGGQSTVPSTAAERAAAASARIANAAAGTGAPFRKALAPLPNGTAPIRTKLTHVPTAQKPPSMPPIMPLPNSHAAAAQAAHAVRAHPDWPFETTDVITEVTAPTSRAANAFAYRTPSAVAYATIPTNPAPRNSHPTTAIAPRTQANQNEMHAAVNPTTTKAVANTNTTTTTTPHSTQPLQPHNPPPVVVSTSDSARSSGGFVAPHPTHAWQRPHTTAAVAPANMHAPHACATSSASSVQAIAPARGGNVTWPQEYELCMHAPHGHGGPAPRRMYTCAVPKVRVEVTESNSRAVVHAIGGAVFSDGVANSTASQANNNPLPNNSQIVNPTTQDINQPPAAPPAQVNNNSQTAAALTGSKRAHPSFVVAAPPAPRRTCMARTRTLSCIDANAIPAATPVKQPAVAVAPRAHRTMNCNENLVPAAASTPGPVTAAAPFTTLV